MPYYVIENTSGSGFQFRVQASSEDDALCTYLSHRSNVAGALRDHDDESDPDQTYHRDGEQTWKYLQISIAREVCCQCFDILPEDHDDPDTRCPDCVRHDDGEEQEE